MAATDRSGNVHAVGMAQPSIKRKLVDGEDDGEKRLEKTSKTAHISAKLMLVNERRVLSEGEASASARTFAVTELLEHMLSNLPLEDLYVLQRVDRNFKDVIQGSTTLQQKMFRIGDESGDYSAARDFCFEKFCFPDIDFRYDEETCYIEIEGGFFSDDFRENHGGPRTNVSVGWMTSHKTFDYVGSWRNIEVVEKHQILRIRGTVVLWEPEDPWDVYDVNEELCGNTAGDLFNALMSIQSRSWMQHLTRTEFGPEEWRRYHGNGLGSTPMKIASALKI